MTEFDERSGNAMRDIGVMRAKAGARSLAIAWPISMGLLMLVGLGLLPAAIVGGAIAGAVSKGFVASRKQHHVAEACRKHGISPQELGADKYLL